jgi:hypothetical protein
MDFGKAIIALKQGKAIQRSGWNGKGLFVVKQIPASINADIIPKMQSLPQSAKDILMSRENPHIDYTNQMLIVNPDGRADSWVPSSSDVFAEDWRVIGEEETFLTRMKEEAADLYYRKEKLGEFLGSERVSLVTETQKTLLQKQYDAMCEYGKILDERIVDIEKQ